jgi:hypothetical protein
VTAESERQWALYGFGERQAPKAAQAIWLGARPATAEAPKMDPRENGLSAAIPSDSSSPLVVILPLSPASPAPLLLIVGVKSGQNLFGQRFFPPAAFVAVGGMQYDRNAEAHGSSSDGHAISPP